MATGARPLSHGFFYRNNEVATNLREKTTLSYEECVAIMEKCPKNATNVEANAFLFAAIKKAENAAKKADKE